MLTRNLPPHPPRSLQQATMEQITDKLKRVHLGRPEDAYSDVMAEIRQALRVGGVSRTSLEKLLRRVDHYECIECGCFDLGVSLTANARRMIEW